MLFWRKCFLFSFSFSFSHHQADLDGEASCGLTEKHTSLVYTAKKHRSGASLLLKTSLQHVCSWRNAVNVYLLTHV
jgi:hypothetical protein